MKAVKNQQEPITESVKDSSRLCLVQREDRPLFDFGIRRVWLEPFFNSVQSVYQTIEFMSGRRETRIVRVAQ